MASYLGLKGTALQTVISGTMGLCFLCFGYAQGVLGGLLTVPAFLDRFPQMDILQNSTIHTARIVGAVVGTWNLGCFLSAILTIFLGDYLGRKKTLMLGLSIWMIGELIQCTSYSFGQLIAGRFIAGFGNGFTTATVPAYQAECVKSHRKGTILMISAGAFIALGLALSYWVVFGTSYLSTASAVWRVPIAIQIGFALIAFFILIFLPESPRWLILTGREDEALKVLSALNDEDIEGPEIRDEFLQIKDAILVMAEGSTSSLTSNKEKRNGHRVVLAYLVQVFQQMSGINLSLQYLALMFVSQLGFRGWVGRLLGACAATEYFLASFIAVVGIDRFWGRRSLMMFGAAGMSGCMIMLTILVYLFDKHGNRGAQIAGAVFLFGFSTFFAIGWQGMAWLYQVEVVPLRIRGPANALSTSGNWLFNFIVVFIAPIAFESIGWRTFIIFACTNAAIVPLVYFLYPETAYRSLEEVDVLFHMANEAPGNPWLNVVRISKTEPLWYGKKGEIPFDYEKSEWHAHYRHIYSSGSTLTSGEKRASSVPGNAGDSSEGARATGALSSDASEHWGGSGHSSPPNTLDTLQGKLTNTTERNLPPLDPAYNLSPLPADDLKADKYDNDKDDRHQRPFARKPSYPESPVLPKTSPSWRKNSGPASSFYSSDDGTLHTVPSIPTIPQQHLPQNQQDQYSPQQKRPSQHWSASTLAPQPLRVSSADSSSHQARTSLRPRSWDNYTTRDSIANYDDEASRASADIRAEGEHDEVGRYPGRLGRGDRLFTRGMRRTQSGRETYAPDGIVDEGEREGEGGLGGTRGAGKAF